MYNPYQREPGWFHGKIRGAGYRLTVPRQLVLHVLSRSSSHMSAEEVYFAVHKEYPAIGLTTVYIIVEKR